MEGEVKKIWPVCEILCKFFLNLPAQDREARLWP